MVFFPRRSKGPSHITGGAVILRDWKVESLFIIEIPAHIYANPNPYDVEALTMLVVLLQLKGQAREASFYTDSETLANQINDGHDTRSFPYNPVVSTITQITRELDIVVFWTPSHIEKKKSNRRTWSKDQQANYVADQLTRGDLLESFKEYPHLTYRHHQLIAANFDEISKAIRARHEYLILDRHLFPVGTKHQLAIWRDHLRQDYLQQRTEASSRNIEGTDLTITLATKVLDTDMQCPIGQRRIMKLVYDKYSNSQYSERSNDCPLCHQGPDIRAHLLQCQCDEARAINTNTEAEAERLPISKGIYSRAMLSTSQTLLLKRTIIDIVQRNSFTLLRIFNQFERDEILVLFHNRQKTHWIPVVTCTN